MNMRVWRTFLIMLAGIVLSVGGLFAQGMGLSEVQEILQEEGIYFGKIDGISGEETLAAIRRFQIREGLAVTGELDAKTVEALSAAKQKENKNAGIPVQELQNRQAPAEEYVPQNEPPTPPAVTSETSQADAAFLEQYQNNMPAPMTPTPAAPVSPAPPAGASFPYEAQPNPSTNRIYSSLFAETPYEQASREVQVGIFKKAQRFLKDNEYYHGQIDGMPGPLFYEALQIFQYEYGLPGTGRLDVATLEEMELVVVERPSRWRKILDLEPAPTIIRGVRVTD